MSDPVARREASVAEVCDVSGPSNLPTQEMAGWSEGPSSLLGGSSHLVTS